MKLTLKQASRLLKTSEMMLLRWADQGIIPSIEKNGKPLFELKVIKAWARRHSLDLQRESEESMDVNQQQKAVLSNAMENGGVYFDIDGDDVRNTLDSALSLMPLQEQLNRNEVLELLMEREKMTSTGIGNGIAIPHPRHPIEGTPETGMIGTFFLRNEIDFNAIDGQMVFVLFIIFSPNTQQHLKLLSQLSFCLHDEKFTSVLRTCRTKRQLLDSVGAIEHKLVNC